MASDQETAQRILGITNALQAGEIDQQTANELAAEDQIALPVVEQIVPESLQLNPPESSAATQAAPAYVPYQPPPEMISAAKVAQQQPNLLDMEKFAQNQYNIPSQTIVDKQPVIAPQSVAQPVQPVEQPVVDIQPTEEQRDIAAEEIIKPAQVAIAEHEATKVAQSEVQAALIRQQDELAERERQIQAEIGKQDNSVRFQSLPEILQGNSFENKLGASLALFIGAVSQGLTGAKTNPVMDFIDRQVALQAEKDKLTADGKLALKKQLIDISNAKLDNLKMRSQDENNRALLETKQQELAIERQKIEGVQALKAQELFDKNAGRTAALATFRGPISLEARAAMAADERNELVSVADKTYRAVNKVSADKFTNKQQAITNAISMLNPYQKLIETGAWATLGKKGVMGALKDRGKAKTMEQAIVGALREPYTGPGALNKDERAGLITAIGDFGLWSLPPVEAEKVKFIIKDLKAQLQNEAVNAGLKEADDSTVKVWGQKYVGTDDGRYMPEEEYLQNLAKQTRQPLEKVRAAYELKKELKRAGK